MPAATGATHETALDATARLPARAVALARLSHERLTRAYNCIAHGVRVCM